MPTQFYMLWRDGSSLVGALGGGQFPPVKDCNADESEKAAQNYANLQKGLHEFAPGDTSTAAQIIDRGKATGEIEQPKQTSGHGHRDLIDDHGGVGVAGFVIDPGDAAFFNDLLQGACGENDDQHTERAESGDR